MNDGDLTYASIIQGLLTTLEGIKQKRSDFDYTYEVITSKKSIFKFFLSGKLQDNLIKLQDC